MEKKVWFLQFLAIIWNEDFIYLEYTLKSIIDEIWFQIF